MKFISNKILFMLLFFTSLDMLYAGTGIDSYLNSPYHDSSLESKKSLFEAYEYKRNYIEKLRTKVEFSHFEDSEVQYSIQAFPKSFAQINIEENIYNIKKSYEIDHSTGSKMLKVRYNTVLNALYQKQLSANIQKQIQLYKHKLRLAKVTLTNSSSIKRLLKIKNKLVSLKMEGFKQNQKYKILLRLIQNDINVSENLDKEFSENWIIKASEIQKSIENIISKNAYKPKEEDLYKVKVLRQKVALDDVKDRWNIRNFSVDYDDSKRKGNAFSVGMSVEIPLPGSGNSKLLNNRLKLLKAKGRVLNREESVKRKVVALKDEIKYLNDYIHQIDEGHINIKKYTTFSKMDGVDAQFLLDLKKENIQYELEKIKANHAMRKAYIALLAVSGKIQYPDGHNYLSSVK